MVTRSRIDIHHHIWPPAFLERNVERIVADSPNFPIEIHRNWTPARALEVMDEHDIARAIGSITSPGVWSGHVADSRRDARDCNEFGARMIADHPGRFGMFAAIPLPDIEGSLEEIGYAFDSLKLDGIGLMTSYDGRMIGDLSFRPVFEELDRRKAVVFVHPTRNARAEMKTLGSDWLAPAILEFPFDTARAIVSLALGGTLARYPNIRFIFCHGGGVLPQLIGRIEWAVEHICTPEQRTNIGPEGLSRALSNVFVDVISMANPGAWPSLEEMAGTERLLFGSDFPFFSPSTTVNQLDALGLDAQTRRLIDFDTAAKLLEGMDSPGRGRLWPAVKAGRGQDH